MSHKSEQLSPETLARIHRVGENVRKVVDAAQRQAAPVVAQALLVWEREDERDDTATAQ